MTFVHARNHQSMWKFRRWHRAGVTRQMSGRLAAPVWVIRLCRNRTGYCVRRIGLERFLDYARRDRLTLAIVKTEAAARAYRDRLQALGL